jgi:transmembrane sensor
MLEKELLRKYLDGQCTEEEKKLVRQYLAEEETDLTGMHALLQDSWQQTADNVVSEEETMHHLQQLRRKLYPAANEPVPMRRRSLHYIWYAAAVVVAAIAVPLFLWRMPAVNKQQVSLVIWDSVINNGSTSIHVKLPDSSVAWVNPNSSLRWNMKQPGMRKIQLEGEAFFDVTHHPEAPFIVQTGRINTRVLGTAFNIESYAHESTLRISLVRGKVAVEKQLEGQDSMQTIQTLQPGEMLNYRKADSAISKESLIITDIRQWTGGYLVLNDVLLSDALRRIEARYNLSITCSNKIRNSSKRLSTVFKQETTDQMLEIISFITGCKYRKTGKNQVEIF